MTAAQVPGRSRPLAVVEAVLAAVTPDTRLVLIDHVTSPTGSSFLQELVRPRRALDTLVDGAHAPECSRSTCARSAPRTTGNCHKWLCAPKGSAFLHVRRDRQGACARWLSHGADAARTDRSRFRLEFDWCGTDDPTPYLCAPAGDPVPRLASARRLARADGSQPRAGAARTEAPAKRCAWRRYSRSDAWLARFRAAAGLRRCRGAPAGRRGGIRCSAPFSRSTISRCR